MVNYNTKSINLPRYSKDLAEETGIHIGDGSLRILKRGTSYFYDVSQHLYDDKNYSDYIIKIINHLYGLRPYVKTQEHDNTRHLIYLSKKLLIFKHKMGLPLGSKYQITIPRWILSNKSFIASCIRGIVDTDGSLIFKKRYKKIHYYPVISVSSISSDLINQMRDIFNKFNIDVSVYSYKSKELSWKRVWAVQICGVENLGNYVKNFGFSNQKHITKLLLWRKYGFSPSKTSTEERKLMLEDKINPKSYYE